MKIYLMRHGEAVSPALWRSGDQDRPLSEKGKSSLLKVLPLISQQLLDVKTILTSPYKRAVETTEIMKGLSSSPAIRETSALASSSNIQNYRDAVIKYLAQGPLLLVGHMPEVSQFAARVTDDIKFFEYSFEPAEIMALDAGEFEKDWGQGKMLWSKTINSWSQK